MCNKEFDYEEFGAELAYQRDYPKQYGQEKKEDIVDKISKLISELESLK